MTTAGGYSASTEALAELAQTFKSRSDALAITGMGMIGTELALHAWGWGFAGKPARWTYTAASEASIAAVEAFAGMLGAVGNAVEALALQYGAAEDDTAGLFDQIF